MDLELNVYGRIGMTQKTVETVTSAVYLIANLNVFVIMDMLDYIVNMKTATKNA